MLRKKKKIEIIENVQSLKPNCLYCETNLPNENEIIKSLPQTKIIITRHCLRLKLLHLYGPYKNNYTNMNVLNLFAQSISEEDDQKNLLITVQLNPNGNNPDFDVTFEMINVMFTLKNFLTLEWKENDVWRSDDQCHISSKPFHKVALVVSSEFNSVMKFHADYASSSDSDLTTELDSQEQLSIIDDNFEDTLQDDIDWSSTPISQNVKVNESTKTEHNKSVPELLEHLLRTVSQDRQEAMEEISQTISSSDSDNENIPQENLGNPEESSLERFIKNNISMLSDEVIEITPLSEIVYPTNQIQMYNFVNIVGIITMVLMPQNELLITDETTNKRFPIKLLTKGIEWFESKKCHIVSNHKEFGLERSTIKYPPLKCGDIVCIRKLCLTLQSTHICAHPDQLTVVELHKENDLIVTTNQRKISAQELQTVAKLAFYNICLLSKISDGRVVNLTGQVLAIKNFDVKKRSELYLLLPDPIHKPCHLDENDEKFILEEIRQMTFHQNRRIYDARVIKEFKSRKQIIKITAYDNHRDILQTMMPLDLALLYNVHVKDERYYNGFFFYTIHSGDDFGRRIASVHEKSVLGRWILSKINPILEEIAIIFDRTLINDYLEQNGTNERKMICSTKNHARTGILTMKKPLKYGSKKDRNLLKSFVNIEKAIRVENFEELLSLEKNSAPNQLYRIESYVSEHDFEDEKNGLPYLNMAHLRQNRLKMICSSCECDEAVPFVSYFLPKAFDLMNNLPKDKCTNCPKCDSIMSPYLSIGLDLMDEMGKYLSVLLSSPECEGLVGYPSENLIYDCPADESFCKSLNFALETLCPVRGLNYSHFWPSQPTNDDSNNDNHTNNNHTASRIGRNLITEKDVNPKLDWILESVEKPLEDLGAKIQIKPKDFEICQTKFDYHVRCMIINE